MMKLSVIIPVYNVAEEILCRCLQSALDIRNIKTEILLVLDGTDIRIQELPSVSRLISEAKGRIKVLAKEHEGVSAARNYGMYHAEGKWLFFLDADDRICGGALEKGIETGEREHADLIVMDYRTETNGSQKAHRYGEEKTEIPWKTFLREVLKPETGMGVVWAKLFRREWLDIYGVTFQTALYTAEDTEFMLRSSLCRPKVWYVPECSYGYCYNPQSAVRKYRKNLADGYISAMKSIRRDLEKSGRAEEFGQEYDNCVLYHLLLIAVNCSFHPDNPYSGRKRRKRFQRLLEEPVFRESLAHVQLGAFSPVRRAALICVKMRLYRGMELIAAVRHWQLRH